MLREGGADVVNVEKDAPAETHEWDFPVRCQPADGPNGRLTTLVAEPIDQPFGIYKFLIVVLCHNLARTESKTAPVVVIR